MNSILLNPEEIAEGFLNRKIAQGVLSQRHCKLGVM
jgi:hypothetical protein